MRSGKVQSNCKKLQIKKTAKNCETLRCRKPEGATLLQRWLRLFLCLLKQKLRKNCENYRKLRQIAKNCEIAGNCEKLRTTTPLPPAGAMSWCRAMWCGVPRCCGVLCIPHRASTAQHNTQQRGTAQRCAQVMRWISSSPSTQALRRTRERHSHRRVHHRPHRCTVQPRQIRCIHGACGTDPDETLALVPCLVACLESTKLWRKTTGVASDRRVDKKGVGRGCIVSKASESLLVSLCRPLTRDLTHQQQVLQREQQHRNVGWKLETGMRTPPPPLAIPPPLARNGLPGGGGGHQVTVSPPRILI